MGPDRIEGRAGRYVVQVDPTEVDVRCFETVREEGRRLALTDPSGVARALRAALDLWRGPPLEDLSDEPSLAPAIARLEEERLSTTEDWIDAELALGRHQSVLGELEELTDRHPFRERFWGQLMVALYRSGRQQEALAAYRRLRELLADELGVDPWPEVQRLHQQVVRQDPELEHVERRLRGYRLLEPVGVGRFGTVHRALQPEMGREVAVKVIRPELANDPDFVRAFDAEAQIAARLEHPHIVPLHDYWREPDGAYLVMRYLRGGNLREVVGSEGLEAGRVVSLVDQLAQALAYAHHEGVVHRDVKPPNILFDEDGNAYLSDFGLARDAADECRDEVGLPWQLREYLSPEAIRGDPVDRKADVYSLGLVAYEALTGHRPWLGRDVMEQAGLPSVRLRRPELPEAVDRVLARATASDVADRPDDVLLVADGLRRALAPVSGSTVAAGDRPEPRNPYKGLRAFTGADADDFHGRRRLVAELLSRLSGEGEDSRFIAVVGPSGSGKSSVVGAGLVPALRAGGLPGSPEWYVAQMVPGAHPFDALALALRSVSAAFHRGLADDLRAGASLSQMLEGLLPDVSPLLLVVDQFEEVFTLVDDPAECDRFLEALAEAATEPGGRVRVVVTLRADFYDQPLAHRTIAPLVAAGAVSVTPLTPAELERAVAAPAEAVGVRVEPALVAALVVDVADQAAPLPLLQYALTEMFDRRTGNELTLTSYGAVGGVSAALARTADELYQRLAAPEREAARQLFLRLVNLTEEGGVVTRRRVSRAELASLDLPPEAMTAAVDAFGARRLLTFDRDPVTRGPTVEVAHEALLREWGRLRDWLETHRSDVLTHDRLAAAARGWAEADRDDSVLLRGERLRRFEEWSGTSAVGLTSAEREFIDAGVARRQGRLRLEQERAARERALERRSLVRLRAALVVVGLFAVVASVLTVVARDERQAARELARAAQARELAAAALATLKQDPELSVLLALEAVATTQHDDVGVLRESEEALHRALKSLRLERLIPQGGAGLGVTGGGRALVTAGAEGRPSVWDSETGERLHTLDTAAGARVLAAAGESGLVVTSGPGTRTGLPVGTGDGLLQLWDVRTAEPVSTLDTGLGDVTTVALSPDGTLLAAGGESGDLHLWSVVDEDRVAVLPGAGRPLYSAAFSPDGATVAAAGEDSVVRTWDVRSRQPLAAMQGHEWPVVALAFSPDGRTLVSGAFDAQARLWDVASGDLVRIIAGGTPVQSLAFSPDGRTLVTGGTDAVATLWSVDTGRELIRLVGHRGGALASVVWLPDGDHVVSSGFDGSTRVWDVSPGGARDWLTVASVEQIFSGVSFSPDGSRFAAPARPIGAAVWRSATGEQVAMLRGHPHKLTSVAFSPDGRLLVGGSDLTYSPPVWDLRTGDLRHRLEGHEGPVRAVEFSPDGERIVTTSFDGLRTWDPRSGQQLTGPVDVAGESMALADSPDGALLAVGEGSTAVLRDGRTLEPRRTLDGHTGLLLGIAFAPDGSVITTADDGTARVWDPATGKARLVLDSHRGPVNQAAVSPDGETVATTGEDGTTRLWDLTTGEERLTLVGHVSLVYGVDFSPDGRLLATASPDGTVALHLLPVGELVEVARRRVTRALTDAECERYLHVPHCP